MESAHDLIAALAASTSDVDRSEPNANQDCQDRLKIALFFDGTGNNKDADEADQKWSNIARLFDSARDEPANGIYARYISGVGTPLNRSEPWWKIARARDSSLLGGSMGWGADSRLESGDMDMTDTLRHALEISSNRAGQEVKAIYDKNQNKGFDELNQALSNHRLIKSIELSVFGFSRGAALARAFINRLLKQCRNENGQLTYQSYPITFRFLGILDTVASFGLPAKNDFKDVDLWLPAELQQCVHYVSAHELRYSFPVDLIRQGNSYPANWREEVFPGVHSDVGGGYKPGDQGRSDTLARVPLCEMFREATLAGARLLDWKRVSTDVVLKAKFLIPEETRSLFDAYMESIGATANSGTVEQRMKAHMKAWYAYKHTVMQGTSPDDVQYQQARQAHQERINQLNAQIKNIMKRWMVTNSQVEELRRLVKQRDSEQTALDELEEGKKQIDGGQATIADEAAALRDKQKHGEPLTQQMIGVAGHYAFTYTAEPWMLDAYYGPAPKSDVIRFFDPLVHDSRAGFLGGNEPSVYFRNRGVWESAHAIVAPMEQERENMQQYIDTHGIDFSGLGR